MGHRIELGEIESAAASIDGVRRCCAVYVSEKSKLGLFYVGEIESSRLLKELKGFLPKYMIPNSLKQLDAMPLTPNGKLDRKLMKNIMEEEG
jgi:acyl-coenzyme A synthetase/AMP-(fatty) acid ligase